MSLAELVQIVSPPAQPVESGTPEGWRSAESKLGVTLPSDFKEMVGRYGTGGFNGE